MNSKLQSCTPDKMVKKKILVIDDNPDIRTLVQYSLEDIGGWDVVTASSGCEGLAKVMAEKPDAIILDGIMPEMGSLAFLKELRTSPDFQFLPVVLVTGCTKLTEHILCSNLDVVGAIIKPFDPMLLSEQVAKLLGWTLEA
ncbi:response regulator [Cylindrospermum sp. FACHB-282]|uniref:response regulator n=1 Tax=Cylindrospermum sp. FACHB-282 TaxID=2692794 RepID=UPI001681FC67|nr:response regulator [Cylindrospermum sp. FACHB-282]MBD2384196.1 response regulator [Cylindrospermum sp. FACHB-282]